MRGAIIAALFTAAVGVSSCAVYDDYAHGRAYAYDGHRYGDYRYDGRLYSGWSRTSESFTGGGALLLDPWLAQTRQGHALVSARFDQDHSGRLDADTAHRANAWFRRHADRDRDLRLTDEEIRSALVVAAAHRT
jgi:hypothetical protein